MTDKNLFPYNLAVVAIFKDEGKYLKEWLDYHLLAGVEHFYLYNNDSSDDYEKILAPYVENNLVTLKNFPGKLQMYPAYHDAIENFRFECRYMAFIDLDEFIFPKTNQSVVEVADEIFSKDERVAGLAINWQVFGSNNLEKADYSRGVLERFTSRAPSDWNGFSGDGGNIYRKVISNPRMIYHALNPHYAYYFDEKFAVNTDAKKVPPMYRNYPIRADKIVVNHYYAKSMEEFLKKKMPKGSSCMNAEYVMEDFLEFDRNEIFDDGILKYRAARAENFSLESHEERIRRTEKTLIKILTQCSPLEAPAEFFNGKLETFLTCRALAEKLGTNIGEKTAEEYSLVWIYLFLLKSAQVTRAEIQAFMRALPEILARPFPICKKINQATYDKFLPLFCEALKSGDLKKHYDWFEREQWLYVQKLLRLIN